MKSDDVSWSNIMRNAAITMLAGIFAIVFASPAVGKMIYSCQGLDPVGYSNGGWVPKTFNNITVFKIEEERYSKKSKYPGSIYWEVFRQNVSGGDWEWIGSNRHDDPEDVFVVPPGLNGRYFSLATGRKGASKTKFVQLDVSNYFRSGTGDAYMIMGTCKASPD